MRRFCFFVVVGLLFTSCLPKKSKNTTIAPQQTLEGCWVNMNILDAISVGQSTKKITEYPPFTELSFVKDSTKVFAINGQIEIDLLSYTLVNGRLKIAGFDGDEESTLIFENDTTLLYTDSFTGKQWRYVKANPSMITTEHGINEAFVSELNARTIAGEYVLIKGKLKPFDVTFRPNGFLFGDPQYARYALCYSGECMNLSVDANLIYFMKDDGVDSSDLFGWTMTDDTLTIYTLRTVSMSDEMTEYVLHSPLYVFKRKEITDQI
jgi:hypothetical protein